MVQDRATVTIADQ